PPFSCTYSNTTSSSSQRSAHHRALHSFPTRRSSDLVTDHAVDAERYPQAGNTEVQGRHGELCGLRPCDFEPVRPLWQHGLRSARDRKSTRLNSSHGSISYAVFCLKKKKNTYTCIAIY